MGWQVKNWLILLGFVSFMKKTDFLNVDLRTNFSVNSSVYIFWSGIGGTFLHKAIAESVKNSILALLLVINEDLIEVENTIDQEITN